jgi:hypothetical protein
LSGTGRNGQVGSLACCKEEDHKKMSKQKRISFGWRVLKHRQNNQEDSMKKNMHRIVIVILAFFSIVGCGDDPKITPATPTVQST